MSIDKKTEAALFRQLAVYGHEAQAKLMKLRVFIQGITGLGIEVAKNIILAGPKQVKIFDNKIVETRDLGSNFYLQQKHIGSYTRSIASIDSLKELNENVKVSVSNSNEIDEILHDYDCFVILDNYDRNYLIELGQKCHSLGKGFILGGNLGLYGYAFIDFGEKHTVFDWNGEPEALIHVAGITKDKEGIVILHEDKIHSLSDGDCVTFSGVKGMKEINGQTYVVKVENSTSFKIGNTSQFSDYISDGIATEVKKAKTVQFKSFGKSLHYPYGIGEKELPLVNFYKFGIPQQLHQILMGFYIYYEKKGRLPRDLNDQDASELVEILNQYQQNKMMIEGEQFKPFLDKNLIKTIARHCRAQISPNCSFWGGIITQQIIKITGKYTPLKQWLHNQFYEIIDDIESKDLPKQSRYYDYEIIFGQKSVENLKRTNSFIVGAGALGCQFLKMFSLMGLGTKNSSIICTDDDNIEMSNLNRQFLFRKHHIGSNKSKIACSLAKKINPEIDIISKQLRVSQENNDTFNDSFWEKVNIVINAVDNVEARSFIDNKCVWYEKPFFESGTLGTKCHSQVILPHSTQSYTDSIDPEEKSIPLCTLKNFPYMIEHTIQWARDYFEGVFAQSSSNLYKFFENKQQFLNDLYSQNQRNLSILQQKLQKLQSWINIFKNGRYSDCVKMAVDLFQDSFNYDIARLVSLFPQDAINTETKKSFWSGLKRFPSIIQFNIQDQLQFQFVQATANIFALALNIPIKSKQQIHLICKDIKLKPFVHKNLKIQISQKEQNEQMIEYNHDEEKKVQQLINKLRNMSIVANEMPQPIIFEKDNDENYHIQFITSVANLRARNYKIEEVDRFKVKLIGGKIIPAIATATAAIVGLVGFEIIKYVLKKNIGYFKNVTVNLALPMFVFNDTNPPNVFKDVAFDKTMNGPLKVAPNNFNKWTKIYMNSPLKINEIIHYFRETIGVDVEAIVYGNAYLWADFLSSSTINLTVEQAITKTLKKNIPAHQKFVCLSLNAKKEGVDCLVPDIKYALK